MRRLSRLSPNLVTTSACGPTTRARLEDATNRAALFGEYDRAVYDAILCLAPGGAFIDVGANASVWSLVAGDEVGPNGLVLAFEPQRLLAEELRADVRLNDLENVYVFDFAIGDATCPQTCVRSKKTQRNDLREKGRGTPTWLVDPANDLPALETMIGARGVMNSPQVAGASPAVSSVSRPCVLHSAKPSRSPPSVSASALKLTFPEVASPVPEEPE